HQLSIHTTSGLKQLLGDLVRIPFGSVIVRKFHAEKVEPEIFSFGRGAEVGVAARAGTRTQLDNLSRRNRFRDGVEAKILMHESFVLRQIPFLIILSEDTVRGMR